MSKLYFRYGVMASSKTLQLLAVCHNYEVYQNKPVFLIKPSKDNNEFVESRMGEKRKADLVLKPQDLDILPKILKTPKKVYCVLVDEAQFLTAQQVYELSEIADTLDIPVICYGLKANFQNNFNGFEGAEALLRWSDKIEEIKTVCFKETCNRKAIMNMRTEDGEPTFEGESIVIGGLGKPVQSIIDEDIDYKPVCRKCYKEFMKQFYYKKARSENVH